MIRRQALKKYIINALSFGVNQRCLAIESRGLGKLQLDDLTGEEKRQVHELWGMKHYLYHRMFKTFVGFDVRYVSDKVFLPYILRALNPICESRAFEEKTLYPLLYDVPQARTIASNWGGVFSIGKHTVSQRDVVNALSGYESFIIKPTHDSTQGAGVRLIKLAEDDVDEILSLYKDGFVAQEVIKQSNRTAIFNASSLNSFRVSTLNINGESTLCNILFRCGREGSVVDNGGAGGLMCGVRPNGTFCSRAYDKHYNTYIETGSGFKFEGYSIPQMADIVRLVLEWHSTTLPHIGFAGWDIALDENDNPIMIEVNLRWPGIQFEQLCSETPLFGERTEEVVEYVKKHPLKLIDVCSI